MSSLLEDARVRAETAENVAAELRRELELRPTELADISNVIEESLGNVAEPRTEAAAGSEVIAQLRAQIEGLEGNLDAQSKESQEKVFNLELANEGLENEIKKREETIGALEFRLRRRNLDEWIVPEYAPEPQEVGNIHEVTESAAQLFDKLRFLDSAFDSAYDYPYQRPKEVYFAFSLLQRNAVARSEGGLGMSIEDWMEKEQGNERVFSYTPHESEATMEVYGPTRYFGVHKMEEHIKIGSGTANKQRYIRIHFCWDQESGRYIIGHVGEHLPIVSS